MVVSDVKSSYIRTEEHSLDLLTWSPLLTSVRPVTEHGEAELRCYWVRDDKVGEVNIAKLREV